MLSNSLFVFFYLCVIFFPAEADLTLNDAVQYLLALNIDANQNQYKIGTDSPGFNRFNRAYEKLHFRIGITGDNGQPLLMETCQAVTANLQHYDQDSALGQVMKARYGRVDAELIIKVIKKGKASVKGQINVDRLVLELFQMGEICGQLFTCSTSQSEDEKLREVYDSLLKFNPTSGAADDVDQVYKLYDLLTDLDYKNLVVMACRHVTANIKKFDEKSMLGETLMEKFGCANAQQVKRRLYKSEYSKKGPITKGGEVAAALFKMDDACADLFPNPNAQSSYRAGPNK